jgi:NADPH:quinone reductase-like Zn-dependent oxidoreductase
MLHANALFPMIVMLFGWSWFAWLGKATGRWSIPVPKGRAFVSALALVLVAFTVFRNLPGFGALAPPS